MADNITGDSRVSYTTKELLERIEIKLDKLSLKLDLKADLADLKDVVRRVEVNERRLETLEAINSNENAVVTFKKFAYGWVPLALNVIISGSSLIYVIFHH